MTLDVLFIRHGVTEWNRLGLIQGHTDTELTEEARVELRQRSVPMPFARAPVHSSPLRRAVETARLLGLEATVLDRRLMEMNWGDWEGQSRAAVRESAPADVRVNEARGPEFRPPGGESPREVQDRILDWATDAASTGDDVVAVTHKGVIKAVLGLAAGWNLIGKSPVKLDWTRGHHFSFDPGAGRFDLVAANVALRAGPGD